MFGTLTGTNVDVSTNPTPVVTQISREQMDVLQSMFPIVQRDELEQLARDNQGDVNRVVNVLLDRVTQSQPSSST